MARIRSVHPGLWTDEAFACLTPDAQIFLIGLFTEADDFGVFDWKPVTLRMRLRPTKDGSVEPLLAELIEANWLKRYEMAGRQMAAIRNFAKWQSPRFPKSTHPITKEIAAYVGLTATDAEKVVVKDEPLQRNAEKPVLLEDGGERRGEVTTLSADADAAPPKPLAKPKNQYPPEFEEFWKTYDPPKSAPKPRALKAWLRTTKQRPEHSQLLGSVRAYRAWIEAETRKRRGDPYPMQHPSTWLNEEQWKNFEPKADLDPLIIAAAQDRADKLMGRGKYAPDYEERKTA